MAWPILLKLWEFVGVKVYRHYNIYGVDLSLEFDQNVMRCVEIIGKRVATIGDFAWIARMPLSQFCSNFGSLYLQCTHMHCVGMSRFIKISSGWGQVRRNYGQM